MILKFDQNSKILIVGTSGSGKTTLARYLSKKIQIQDVELDQLFWQPNWVETPQSEFREKILKAISNSSGFVIHGNYNKVRDITWKNSDIVIWLDYPKWLVMWRVFKRSIHRILKQEVLWAGNKESFKKTFFTKDSIIRWAWVTYSIRKQQYETLFSNPEYDHLKVVRLKNQSELDSFLEHLSP